MRDRLRTACRSPTTQTGRDLAAGLAPVDDRGEHELKGVPERWRLYAVAPERPS